MELEDLLCDNRVPVLFIGSGLSKRYLKDFPKWDELLEKIAGYLGIDSFLFTIIKQRLGKGESVNAENARIADYLENEITRRMIEEPEKVDIHLSDEEKEYIHNNNISIFKYLIAKEFRIYEIKEEKLEEINKLKEAIKNVGIIITTNYDKFIEDELAEGFDVKYKQTQLYYSNNYEYMSVYKIHGTIADENSIVITTKDYDEIAKNNLLFNARIYDLLLSNPMIFLGYSICDEDISILLQNFADCFDADMLEKIAKNLILVKWQNGEEDFKMSLENVSSSNGTKRFPVTVISTDNYSAIYDKIKNIEQAVSPQEVYKIRKLIYKLVKDNEKGREKVKYFGDDSILDANENKLVIAIGEQSDVEGAIEKVKKEIYTKEDVLRSVLFADESQPDIDFIVNKYIPTSSMSFKNNFPVFYLVSNYPGDWRKNDKIKKNYEYLKGKFKSKIKNTIKLMDSKGYVKSLDFIIEASKSNELKALRVEYIIAGLKKGIMTTDDLKTILKDIYNKDNNILKVSTKFRELLALLDYYQFTEKETERIN